MMKKNVAGMARAVKNILRATDYIVPDFIPEPTDVELYIYVEDNEEGCWETTTVYEDREAAETAAELIRMMFISNLFEDEGHDVRYEDEDMTTLTKRNRFKVFINLY